MDTLISNVTIVTMNEKMDVLFGAFLGIKDGKIASVSKTAPKEQPATIIDGTGMVVMPGLINCHTHLATTGLRSYCDDLSTLEALDAQLVKEDKMDSRSAKAAALLGIAECGPCRNPPRPWFRPDAAACRDPAHEQSQPVLPKACSCWCIHCGCRHRS